MDGKGELLEVAKVAVLIKEKNLFSFVSTWKPRLDFLLDTENSDFRFC